MLSRFLVIGVLFALSSGCSLSADSDYAKVSIRMTGASPVARLFAPLTQGLFTPPTTTAGFDCLGVNVMGFGIPPKISNCGCTGTGCTCGQGQVENYLNLNQNIAGQTFCGYAGVSSIPIANDASPKTIRLTVPSGPKRIVEILGVIDTYNVVCNQNIPIGDIQYSETTKPDFYDVGRVVTDLFSSKNVAINDTFTDLTGTPALQAVRKVNCQNAGAVPPSYIAYIPTVSGIMAYWPMFEPSGTTATILVGSTFFSSMPHVNSPTPGSTGPLIQTADSSANYALNITGATSYASGTVTSGFMIPGALSVEAWVRFPGICPSPYSKIFELGPGTPVIKLHCLYPTNTAGFQVFDGTGSVFSNSTVALNDGNWHHIVGVYDPPNGAVIYVDGVSVSTGQSGSSVSSLTFSSANPFGIGGSTNNLPTGSDISHVAVYGTALSASEVLKHYKASGR